jgi:hypothetical protein
MAGEAPPADELEALRRRRGFMPFVCDVCDRKAYAQSGHTPPGWRVLFGAISVIQSLCPDHPDWKAWR